MQRCLGFIEHVSASLPGALLSPEEDRIGEFIVPLPEQGERITPGGTPET